MEEPEEGSGRAVEGGVEEHARVQFWACLCLFVCVYTSICTHMHPYGPSSRVLKSTREFSSGHVYMCVYINMCTHASICQHM